MEGARVVEGDNGAADSAGSRSGPPPGPWTDLAQPPSAEEVQIREPLTRAPWPPLLIIAVLIGIYVWQIATGDAAACAANDPAAACVRYAFSAAQLKEGRYVGLLTALFMHGSWAHVLFNSIFCLAFGAPVARLFGLKASGVFSFLMFFLVCGVIGNLGYAAMNPEGEAPVLGASGAIAGFMGAASRLVDRPMGPDGKPRGLAPFTDRTVVAMAAAWVVLNVIVGVLGVDIGFGAAGQPVAWEAHLWGYAAGLLLVGPTARMLGRL